LNDQADDIEVDIQEISAWKLTQNDEIYEILFNLLEIKEI